MQSSLGRVGQSLRSARLSGGKLQLCRTVDRSGEPSPSLSDKRPVICLFTVRLRQTPSLLFRARQVLRNGLAAMQFLVLWTGLTFHLQSPRHRVKPILIVPAFMAGTVHRDIAEARHEAQENRLFAFHLLVPEAETASTRLPLLRWQGKLNLAPRWGVDWSSIRLLRSFNDREADANPGLP
jgi:hypothetical protein